MVVGGVVVVLLVVGVGWVVFLVVGVVWVDAQVEVLAEVDNAVVVSAVCEVDVQMLHPSKHSCPYPGYWSMEYSGCYENKVSL